jgi:hypothetical protein
MNILDKVQEVFNQYELKPIELPKEFKDVYLFLRAYPEFGKDFKSEIDDNDLNTKYRKYIPKGWYGFDVGTPIVPVWMEIIDKIVEGCVAIDPDFEIHQIKLKFGYICFYCGSNIIDDLHQVEFLMAHKLQDKALIY